MFLVYNSEARHIPASTKNHLVTSVQVKRRRGGVGEVCTKMNSGESRLNWVPKQFVSSMFDIVVRAVK